MTVWVSIQGATFSIMRSTVPQARQCHGFSIVKWAFHNARVTLVHSWGDSGFEMNLVDGTLSMHSREPCRLILAMVCRRKKMRAPLLSLAKSIYYSLTYADDIPQLSDATTNMNDSNTWNKILHGRRMDQWLCDKCHTLNPPNMDQLAPN